MDTVTIIIAGDRAEASVPLTVNGHSIVIPRNVETPIPVTFLPSLVASSYDITIIENLPAPESPAQTGSGGSAEGTGSPAAATNRFEDDPGALDAFLDPTVATIAPLLINLNEAELRTALAAEQAGKTRKTIVAAITAALAPGE